MQNEESSIQISLTPRFQKDLKKLKKRYPAIRKDVEPLTKQLQAGEIPGDRITDIEYEVFKVRLKNSNINKGKSGGYRVIYYVKTEQTIILITIYSKSDQSDVSNGDIIKAIENCLSEAELTI